MHEGFPDLFQHVIQFQIVPEEEERFDLLATQQVIQKWCVSNYVLNVYYLTIIKRWWMYGYEYMIINQSMLNLP